MRESKQQESPLFRLGAVYRQEDGDVVELVHGSESPIPRHESDIAWAKVPGGSCGYGFRSLITGEDVSVASLSEIRRLIPGELHEVGGQWVALGVDLADAAQDITITYDEFLALCGVDPNAAMIGRDGKPRITVKQWPSLDALKLHGEPFTPTAKPAISGLQREYSSTHLLGSYR